MIWILGDPHGNIDNIIKGIEIRDIKDSHILCVGDFGVGFKRRDRESEWLLSINNELKRSNNKLISIRGNHDDPDYFKGGWILSNLELVPDWTVREISGKKFLLVGGAISPDRFMNMNINRYHYHNTCYWKDEGFVLDKEKLSSIRGIDSVITHSAPNFCHPINKPINEYMSHGPLIEEYSKMDINLKRDINRERNDIETMFNILIENNDIKKWYYGHFHESKLFNMRGVDFRIVDKNEFCFY